MTLVKLKTKLLDGLGGNKYLSTIFNYLHEINYYIKLHKL